MGSTATAVSSRVYIPASYFRWSVIMPMQVTKCAACISGLCAVEKLDPCAASVAQWLVGSLSKGKIVG